jgi:hypothetical protein
MKNRKTDAKQRLRRPKMTRLPTLTSAWLSCVARVSGVLLALAVAAGQVALADEDEEAEERERTEALEASRDWLGGIPAAPT